MKTLVSINHVSVLKFPNRKTETCMLFDYEHKPNTFAVGFPTNSNCPSPGYVSRDMVEQI
jgi:hypothetical protein